MATSRHLWTRDLLVLLGCPGSYENAVSIIAQAQAEGGADGARFNPLNSTREAVGSTVFNTIRLANGQEIHVWNYPSYKAGLEITAATFRQANMAPLLAALKKGSSARGYWTALGKSPWGTFPPGGMSIDSYLYDARRHWFDRAMVPISGT